MIRQTSLFSVLLVSSCAVVLAQDRPPAGWRRVGDPVPPVAQVQAPQAADAFGQPLGQQPPPPQERQQPGPPPEQRPVQLPPELVLQPGTFMTIRLDQMLHSDRNQPGDVITGTLMQPVVIDGIVVAQRGQTVFGRVT